MIPKIKTLSMQILSQILPARKVRREETDGKTGMCRRIEITRVRESVSVLVSGRRKTGEQ